MKARRIDLSNYTVIELKTGKPRLNSKKELVQFDVRGSVIDALLNRVLHLGGQKLLDQMDFARRLRDEANNVILLNQEEHSRIVSAVASLTDLTYIEEEFIRRILQAPEVEVQEKIEEKPDVNPKQ